MRTHSPSSRIFAVVLAASAALVAACSSADPATGTSAAGEDFSDITINVMDAVGPQRLAAAGLDDFPYQVNFVKVTSSADMGNALNSGQTDLALNSDVGVPTFISQGVPITVIHAQQRPANLCGILVPTDSAVQSVSDLKGRKVANTTDAGSESVAYRAFSNAGLNYATDVELVQLAAPSDGATALLSGQVDAWAGCSLPVSTLLASDKARFIADGSQPQNPWIAQNYWVATGRVLTDQSKTDAIVDYIGRVDKALAWANDHVEEVATAEAALYQAPYEATLEYNRAGPTTPLPVDQFVIDGLQSAYDFRVGLGKLKPGANVGDAVTSEFNDRISAAAE